MSRYQDRLYALALDGVVDVEDIDFAVRAALADGSLSPSEVDEFRQTVLLYAGLLEPGAKAWLEAWVAGGTPRAPDRLLLAPQPRRQPVDLYQPRRDVVALQEALGALGFPTGVDGDYGPGTARAVSGFQAGASLPTTGVVDSATLAALNAALDAKGAPLLDVTLRDFIRPDQVLATRTGSPPGFVQAVQSALNHLAAAFQRTEWSGAGDGRWGDATERAVRAFQAAAWLPATGVFDTATLAALNTALASTGHPLVPRPAAAADTGAVELHFYPGEHKVLVRRGAETLDAYAMVGGYREARPDPRNPGVRFDPTPAGQYEVVDVGTHVSGAWAASYIPFGTSLREAGGEIQFKDERGQWQWATGPQSPFAGRNPPPLGREAFLGSDGTVMPTWRFNDFGHLRARLKDIRTGRLVSHMVHASPFNELTPRYYADTRAWLDAAVAVVELHYSHGCEHIHPRDLDQMITRGYLEVGTRFVVHGYDEHAGGPAIS